MVKAKLNRGDVSTIVAMIEVWDGPLTWHRLTARITAAIGRSFSRQALDAHAEIKMAYQSRKARLRNVLNSVRAGKADDPDVPPELAMSLQRAAALEARLDTLKATLEAYEIKFVTWLYNARIMGLSEDVLNSPLASVDRNADNEPGSTRGRLRTT